ncbi:hypothetical protein [Streptomyces flavofungini]|uniref:hypothetical protein n=1 Tax=Streptomyces flavofungini TaxID=68200 RepID=UPI0025AFCA71|nr:hypothetical protein [Streptomyces flavofungini]WJV51716.1 hypothetical protein QUY26_40365 [Streptomyces flavofungini]
MDFDFREEVSFFTTLHPDGEVDHSVGRSTRTALLTGLPILAGVAPCATLPLGDGIELHHQGASTDAANPVASRLAAHYGHEDLALHGPVYLTGDSGESDTATGMAFAPFDALCDALNAAAGATGIRLYRKVCPGEDVIVAYDDFVPGDTFWFLGTSRRVLRFEDMDPRSATAQNDPGARLLVCDDGFAITALPGAIFPERADRAPAGYWQRTGNRLLPAG